MMDTEVVCVLGPMFLWKKLVSEHLYSICPAKLFTAKLCVFKTNLVIVFIYKSISLPITFTVEFHTKYIKQLLLLFSTTTLPFFLVCPLPVLNSQPYDW